MEIHALQQEILRLKKARDICILAHSYQAREIVEIADFPVILTSSAYRPKQRRRGLC